MTTNQAETQRLEMMRCCELADCTFLEIHNGFLYLRRNTGFTNVLCIPVREVTPLRILLELCMDTQHVRQMQRLAATSSPAQISPHLIAAEGN